MFGRPIVDASSEIQSKFPRSVLICSHILLLSWIAMGTFIFHFIEFTDSDFKSNDNIIEQANSTVIIRDLHQNFETINDISILSMEVFTNSTSTYAKIIVENKTKPFRWDLTGSLFFCLVNLQLFT